ncbi:MAG: thioesterase family protein [Rhodospirillales bacterium]|nr:thioesterase family protein [Rhodospirillales bacterium]
MDELPITHRGAVMPWECDFMGHMNVVFHMAKFDQATWPLLASIGFTADFMKEHNVGVGAVRYDTRYFRELRSGATITVRSRIVEVRDKVIRYVHEMTADRTGELAATAEVTAVHMDTVKRRSKPFDEEILARARAAMAGHETVPRPEQAR